MKKRQPRDSDYSFCVRNGVTIYPVYDRKKKAWLIEVCYEGKPQVRYKKEIGKGLSLSGKKIKTQLEATAKHWADKIENNNQKI